MRDAAATRVLGIEVHPAAGTNGCLRAGALCPVMGASGSVPCVICMLVCAVCQCNDQSDKF